MNLRLNHELRIGLECLSSNPKQFIHANERIGLLLNQASVDSELRLSADLVHSLFPGKLTVLFSPQHGIWGEQQANMLETDHGTYPSLGLPVYSLYSQTRRPDADVLDKLDCLIVDLQDVGTRVYTFIWTLLEVLKACAEQNKRVIVLDRPNPIGGEIFEGPLLEIDYRSFVGGWTIPMRHGLTIGEVAKLLVGELEIDVDLEVLTMIGWRRGQLYHQLKRAWIWPSPNMPTPNTTLLYPGQVLLEGVNLSEGRGTTRPFELIGAPYVNSELWIEQLSCFNFPGIKLLTTRFQPTFDKWRGQSCHGLDLQVLDPWQVRSFHLTICLIATAAKLFDSFAWLPPPYEYEYVRPPIDILYGSSRLREAVENFKAGHCDHESITALAKLDESRWRERIRSYLLYHD